MNGTPPLSPIPAKCASMLVHRGLLTPFQARLLLAGKHRGFRLGSYIVRDQLGQGGMGAVYAAEHETLKRRVALKVLTGSGQDKLILGRFLREARAAAALDHPNIVRIFDVSQHGDMHYLVMEHVEGQTLDRIVAGTGPLPIDAVADCAAQVAAGLQHAHEKGFVHRDIKPANLMVSKDGTLKILDMGLARSFDEKDKLTELMDKGAVLGTADYLAPEMAMGNSPDIRADIYSLGATMFSIITGRPLFDGNATQKLLQHQTAAVPSIGKLRPDCPAGLMGVVNQMLAKRAEDRFQTPADVVTALAPWMTPSGASRVLAGLSSTGAGSSTQLQQALSGVVTRVDKSTDLSATPRPWAMPTRDKAPSSKIVPAPAPVKSGALAPPTATPVRTSVSTPSLPKPVSAAPQADEELVFDQEQKSQPKTSQSRMVIYLALGAVGLLLFGVGIGVAIKFLG